MALFICFNVFLNYLKKLALDCIKLFVTYDKYPVSFLREREGGGRRKVEGSGRERKKRKEKRKKRVREVGIEGSWGGYVDMQMGGGGKWEKEIPQSNYRIPA